ncbi:hypothetical protein [Frondihabitans cladoniiphilus]|uniref:Uncharacterized protein n=1 Tax=Frondihabitans cladoniiphilus TaxID=715785 RepID=A0ABP8VZT5_9MICO
MSNDARRRGVRFLNLAWVVPLCFIVVYVARAVSSFAVCGLTGCVLESLTPTNLIVVAFATAAATTVVLFTVALAPWGTDLATRWLVAALAAGGAGFVVVAWTVVDFTTNQDGLFY